MTTYRITVDNYHAQIRRTDPVGTFRTVEEAAAEIVDRICYGEIEEMAIEEANAKHDYDENTAEWEKVYSEVFERIKADLVAGESCMTGNGHRYSVATEQE